MLFRSRDDMNYVGVCSDALDGNDKYDFGEPPPAPDGAYLAFVLPSDNSSRYRVPTFVQSLMTASGGT